MNIYWLLKWQVLTVSCSWHQHIIWCSQFFSSSRESTTFFALPEANLSVQVLMCLITCTSLCLLQRAGRGVWAVAVLKQLPAPVAKFLVYSGIANRMSDFFRMAPRSLTDVVNSLTENKDLRAVFSYIFGTYGRWYTAMYHSTLWCCNNVMNNFYLHFKCPDLCQIWVVWRVEGWQGNQLRSRLLGPERGVHPVGAGCALSSLPKD